MNVPCTRVDVVVPDEAGARQVEAAALVVLLPAHHVVAHAERVASREKRTSTLTWPWCSSAGVGTTRPERFGERDHHLAALAAPLVAAEVEHLVPDERAADGAAELLLVVRRLDLSPLTIGASGGAASSRRAGSSRTPSR